MRTRSYPALGGLVAILVAAGSIRHAPADEPRPAPAGPASFPYDAVKTAAERAADEAAYTQNIGVAREHLLHEHLGEWVAIAGGRVFPQNEQGTAAAPADTLEKAVAAADAAVPQARHRFVFRLGEEGDFWHMLGGVELPHVLGNRFLALLERPDVEMRALGPGQRIHFVKKDVRVEFTAKSPDLRMVVRPEIGPVGGAGKADALYVLSTGFSGYGTLSAETAAAAALHLWEIPGSVSLQGAFATNTGKCRRARARLKFPGTDLDFVMPVAIWPGKG